jgi:tetratricopeptide (TPR) repeat protein
MSDTQMYKELSEDIEAALLDTDLFLKYGATEKAMSRLQAAINHSPRSIVLRERLRELATSHKNTVEAARQCLALAGLYLGRQELDLAYTRLIEAKQLDPRISITKGLEAIKRARLPNPQAKPVPQSLPSIPENSSSTLSGDLSMISLFDVVQVVENSRLTGVLNIKGKGRILFNQGLIVDAETNDSSARKAFITLAKATSGPFQFEVSAQEFPVTINIENNTGLILDSLRLIDEESK